MAPLCRPRLLRSPKRLLHALCCSQHCPLHRSDPLLPVRVPYCQCSGVVAGPFVRCRISNPELHVVTSTGDAGCNSSSATASSKSRRFGGSGQATDGYTVYPPAASACFGGLCAHSYHASEMLGCGPRFLPACLDGSNDACLLLQHTSGSLLSHLTIADIVSLKISCIPVVTKLYLHAPDIILYTSLVRQFPEEHCFICRCKRL